MEVTWSRWHWRKNWVEKGLADTGERQQASQEAVQRRSSDGPSSGSDSAPQTTLAREGTFTISPAVRIPVLQMRNQGPARTEALHLQEAPTTLGRLLLEGPLPRPALPAE